MSKPKIGTDDLEPQFQSSTRAIMTINESSPTAFQGSNPSDNLKLDIATFEILKFCLYLKVGKSYLHSGNCPVFTIIYSF